MKVIITGVTGFIGKALCKKLLLCGHKVVGVGRNQKILDVLSTDSNFCGLSLDFDHYFELCQRLEADDYNLFIHLANKGTSGAEKERYDVQLKNLDIACKSVELAHSLGCKRFVFVGSVDEFEVNCAPDVTYSLPTHSRIYGITKLAAENLGKILAQKCGIEYVSAILALTYGEGNNTNIFPNLIMKSSIEKKSMDFIEGNNLYDIIYIDEAIEGILGVAEYGQNMESYYVGHDNLITFRDMVERINSYMDYPIKLNFGHYKDIGKVVDFNKINRKKLYQHTGVVCDVTLEEGIRKTYEWIKKLYE